MFVTFAWLPESADPESFDAEIPLTFLGEQIAASRFGGRFLILFLSGLQRLSVEYAARLQQLGFEVVDFEDETRRLQESFRGLSRFQDYGRFCFLRWLALREFLRMEGITEQIIHLDGDVAFNATPNEVATDLAGRTFVLQGCPAVTSITDRLWLDQYAEALRAFSLNPESYCARAWNERKGLEHSSRERWSGFWPQPLFTHDQDLISYLIHTERIIQDHPATFARDLNLYYAQNPFWLQEGAAMQLGRSIGLDFSTRDAVCFLERKKIALWHFQSFYARQMNSALVMHRAGYHSRFPDENTCTPSEKWCWERARQSSPLTRRQLYASIRELSHAPAEATFSFGDFYSASRFWAPTTFSNGNPS